jgi:hypothetical protein
MKHQRGITGGQKWLYCAINHIVSWHPEDYNHKYCASEHIFVEDMI